METITDAVVGINDIYWYLVIVLLVVVFILLNLVVVGAGFDRAFECERGVLRIRRGVAAVRDDQHQWTASARASRNAT